MKVIRERSQKAADACTPGFHRIEGICEKDQSEEPVRTAQSGHKKHDRVARKHVTTTVEMVRPLAPPTLGIVPAAWVQGFGDYEYRRNALDSGAPGPYNRAITTWGLLAGADLTVPGISLPNDGGIIGILSGYSESYIRIMGSPSFPVNSAINLRGASVGFYGSYFAGAFSLDSLVKADFYSLTDSNSVGGSSPSSIFGTTTTTNLSFAQNFNYRFTFDQFWVEPTAGARVTFTDYGGDAAALGFAHGYDARVQGGFRFGSSMMIGNNVLFTPILTTVVYNDVTIKGFIAQDLSSTAAPITSTADQGKFRGQGILALNFNFGNGVSSFVQGELRGGNDYLGGGGRVGVRVAW